MGTKSKPANTQTEATEPTAQASAANQPTPEATPSQRSAVALMEQVANTKPEKKAATTATKREKKACAHTGCKLWAQQPSEFCSNHKPSIERLTVEQQCSLSKWIEAIEPRDRLLAFVNAFGPVKSGQLADALTLARVNGQ